MSSESFFITLAQISASLTGFTIAIAIVIHQLESRERRKRTAELRDELEGVKQRYNNEVLYSVMEIIEQPFQGTVPENIDNIEKISIKDLLENDYFDNNIHANQIWYLTYKLSNELSDVSPSKKPDSHYLIPLEELKQISNSVGYINKHIDDGNVGLRAEIERQRGVGNMSLTKNIFDTNKTDYNGYSSWLETTFSNYEQEGMRTGNDLHSLSEFFSKLEKDMNAIVKNANNTILDEETVFEGVFLKLAGAVLTGILLPILSLLNNPGYVPQLSGYFLTGYQLFLLLITVGLFYLIVIELSDRI